MKDLLYCLLLILFLLPACQEDEPAAIVLAGVYDSRMLYHELNPALELTLTEDALLQVAYGEDSLDLNQDGSFDVIISGRIPLDYKYNKTTTNDTYPFFRLYLKNTVEVAYEKETYYIGLGQTSSTQWIDTIAYKENVRNITTWTESNIYRFMWVDPPTIFWGTDGPWFNLVNSERYIAIRQLSGSHYRYGWIKVKEASREKIAIASYALEK